MNEFAVGPVQVTLTGDNVFLWLTDSVSGASYHLVLPRALFTTVLPTSFVNKAASMTREEFVAGLADWCEQARKELDHNTIGFFITLFTRLERWAAAEKAILAMDKSDEHSTHA